MGLKDKNGKEIKPGHELNVPLDVFSNGYVVLDKEKQLSLELRHEAKKLPLKHFNENFLKAIEVLN
jgi:hypothetical protein